MDPRKKRLATEMTLLEQCYQPMQYDNIDYNWLHIYHFSLPSGWNKSQTALLIEIPPAYPHVPPNGWYMDKQLKIAKGQVPSHYFQDKGTHNRHGDLGWAWYCLHPDQQSWQASTHILNGDNLLKYLELIRALLVEISQKREV